MVVLPTFLTIIYYAFISTPVYVSESKVIVKSLGDTSGLSGLGAFLKTFGLLDSTTAFGNLLVNHIHSRDVMFKMDREIKIKEYYSSEEWDLLKRFDPFGLFPSYEHFLEHYREFVVNAYVDPSHNLIVIRVRGKDPEYPYQLNRRLLEISEVFVNEMNKRIYTNAFGYYEGQLEESRQKIKDLSKRIVAFLNRTGVVSPEQQIGALLQITAKLQEQLIVKEIELSRLKSIAPMNPRVEELKREIEQIREEIDSNLRKVAGGSSSVGPASVELELLKSEMTMLIKELEANLSAYLQARNQASMQLLFVETVEAPAKPDAPMEPRVIRNILTVFALSFVIWALYWFITSAAREHAE